jgi:hypothetical protein
MDEYFWMQKAVENNLVNNELMMGLMIQMHHENGWDGPEGYPDLHVPEQHDEGQPRDLAPTDPRDEISLAPP